MIKHMTRGAVELSVGGRDVRMQGEAYLRGHGSPDFVAYRNSLTHWEDGQELTEADKQTIIDDLLSDARERGWTIEVE